MARYIDADALQERLQDFADWCRDGRKQGVDFVLDFSLPNTPTADVQEVNHAKWKKVNSYIRKCTNCGFCAFENATKVFNYCPNCGARMEGE